MLSIFKQYYPIRNIFFVFGEGVLILLSVSVASYLISGMESSTINDLLMIKIVVVTIICQLCLYYNDLYDLTVTKGYSELGIRMLRALGATALILAPIYFFFPSIIIGSATYTVSTGIIITVLYSWRLAYTLILKRGFLNEKFILLGDSELAHNILNEISSRYDSGYEISGIAFIENSLARLSPKYKKLQFREGFTGLCEKAKSENINKIVVALEEKRGLFPTRELLSCRVAGIDILEGATFLKC